MTGKGDQAFLKADPKGRWFEMTYDGDHGFETLSSPRGPRNGIHAAIEIAKERAGDAPFDHAEITALAAAHVAHDWICVLAEKAGAKIAEVGRT